MSDSKYIRLQELVIDTFNLDAPVEIEKGALLLESTSKTVLLQLRLNVLDNVNDISSTSFNICGFTDSGEPVEGLSPFTYTFSDIYLQGKKTFGDRTPIILDPRIRKVKVEIDKVVFRNGDVWRHPEGYFSPPTQMPVSSIKAELFSQFERETKHLSEVDKHNFQYFPHKFDNYWQCTCGRPNRNDAETCSRCGLKREVVFHVTDEDNLRNNLQKFNEQVRIAEEARLRAEAEKKALVAKEKRQLTIVLITLFAIGSLLSIFFFVIQPAIKYNRATAMLTNKDFDGAISSFTALEDYKDSSELLKESSYQKGLHLLSNNKFDESIDIFTSLGEYKDSNELIKDSTYQKGIGLLSNKAFDESIPIFSSLGDYRDSSEMLQEATYQKANDLLLTGIFPEAIELFEGLENYKESGDLLNEAQYLLAMQYFSEENYNQAISIFSTLENFKDASQKLPEAKYLLALHLNSVKDFDGAISLFKQIPDYKGSKECLDSLLYKKAVALYEKGEFILAEQVFLEVIPYNLSHRYSSQEYVRDKLGKLIGIQGIWKEDNPYVDSWLGFTGWHYYYKNEYSYFGWTEYDYSENNLTSMGLTIMEQPNVGWIEYDYFYQTLHSDGFPVNTWTKISDVFEP